MLMLLYSAALILGLLISSPWWLFRMLTTERYREGLAQRLGRVPQHLRQAITGKRTVWLHAVSVGEVLAASRLVTELEAALGDGWRVVISTTTRTGQTLARERFGADRVFYFPLDFAFAVRAYMRALQPAALVLMESELWPRVLHECERGKIPVIVVNARVSDRSFRRAVRVRSLWGPMLRKVTLWLAQSDEDARRLVAMGAREASVSVGGNLKFDIRSSKTNDVAAKIKQLAGERPIIVAGSLVGIGDGFRGDWEETPVIRAWEGAPRQKHTALLVLAPRHPERFGLVESIVMEYQYALASEANKHAELRAIAQEFGPNNYLLRDRTRVEVVLLNTIGDLASVYGIADIAFVGGSLLPRGGHNPLEPAQFGVPVIMGPSFENFRDIVADLQQANGIRIVQNELELAEAFQHLLTDKQAARTMGENGRTVFHQRQGATKRAVQAVLQLVRGAAA